MTMYKALHPRDDIERLHVSRREGGRGLASIEDSVDSSIRRLEDFIEKHEEGRITAIRSNTDNTMAKRNIWFYAFPYLVPFIPNLVGGVHEVTVTLV